MSMTEDFIHLAKEAGFDTDLPPFKDGTAIALKLARLVASASRSAEREACEALHDHEDVQAPVGNSSWGEAYQEGWGQGTAAYREAIRARGQV